MSQININWHYVAEGLLILALLFVVVVCIGVVLAYFAKKGSPAAQSILKTVEADAGKAWASPVVQADVKSVEAVARLAAEAAVAKMQTAQPVTIANHPALTVVADVLQESQATKDTLAKVQAVLGQAQAVAGSKPAA